MKERKKEKGPYRISVLTVPYNPMQRGPEHKKNQELVLHTLWFNIRIPKGKCTYGLKSQMSSKCSIREHKNAVWTVVASKRDVQYLKIQLLHRSSMSPRFTINALKQKEKQKINFTVVSSLTFQSCLLRESKHVNQLMNISCKHDVTMVSSTYESTRFNLI